MSRSLDVLQPEFREKLEQAISLSKDAGYMMVPYETQRDVWDQAKYWRRSRNRSQINAMCHKLRSQNAPFLASVIEEVGPQTGRWATNAIPGLSWHQWGLAADLYWDSNGDAPGGIEWSKMEGYAAFAKIARDTGPAFSGARATQCTSSSRLKTNPTSNWKISLP